MTARSASGGNGDVHAHADGEGPVPSTAGQAAAYQRLRSHLAYLKLPTAAEQLPAVLDAARAEQLSVTAALERLLGAEVSATEDRRVTGRLRFASLPAPSPRRRGAGYVAQVTPTR